MKWSCLDRPRSVKSIHPVTDSIEWRSKCPMNFIQLKFEFFRSLVPLMEMQNYCTESNIFPLKRKQSEVEMFSTALTSKIINRFSSIFDFNFATGYSCWLIDMNFVYLTSSELVILIHSLVFIHKIKDLKSIKFQRNLKKNITSKTK